MTETPPSSPSLDADPTDVPILANLTQEVRIRLAIDAVRASGTRSDGQHMLSLRQAAKDFDVPRSTLTGQFNGTHTRKEAHEREQKLQPAQEEVLVKWIKVMGQRGVPLTPGALLDYASEICDGPVGSSWGKRFMARHPELKIKWTTSLQQCRAHALNPTVVAEYFKILAEVINEHQIPIENIYNMDEKGIQLGVGKRVAAIIDRDQKNAFQVEDGNRELVTIIETICADGTALHPSVIFQGKRRNLEWGRQNPCNARYVTPLTNQSPLITCTTASRSLQRDGQIKSLAIHGSSVTSSLKQPLAIQAMGTACSFSMDTIHIARTDFASLPKNTASLSFVYHRIQLISSSLVMLACLARFQAIGKLK